MKLGILAMAVAPICVLSTFAGAAVVLTSTAPTNATSTYAAYPSGSPLKLSSASDFFALGTFSRGATSVSAIRPSGSAFGGDITLLTANPPASPTTSNSGFRLVGGGFGPNFQRPDLTVYNGQASNQAQAYTSTATDGTSLTYTLAANTTKTLNYYIGSYDAKFEYTLTADSVQLAAVTTPTGMTGGDDTTSTPGNLHNNGVLSFTLSNTSSTASLITFSLLYAGNVGSAQSLGIQAATATPEPAMLSLAGLAGVGLLQRRRKL